LNILVTGGAGYIGSHACKALAAKGYVPVTYDNLSRGNPWAVKWGPLEKGDIADVQTVHAVLERYLSYRTLLRGARVICRYWSGTPAVLTRSLAGSRCVPACETQIVDAWRGMKFRN
jgi:NAD dependent epimerase/dehydratase family